MSSSSTSSTAPTPPAPIKDQCTVIHDNTLYVYTPDNFLSLDLKQNATWNTLPNGVGVKGGVCVKGTDQGPNTGEALWVVGGVANDSNPDYPGLQKFSFADKKWDSIAPITTITKNRRNHGAAFLNETGQILIYAGSQQDPNTPSIETFVIETVKPFNVISASSDNTPVIAPVLLQWDQSSAVAVGGSERDTNIYHFTLDQNKAQGTWKKYDTALPSALKAPNEQQATIAQGSDGSKVLELYDCSVKPNTVLRYVLQDDKGNPAPTGTEVGDQNTKRDLTLANWPDYNGTAAPSFTRDGFSLARADNGLVAMTGGNEQNPVSLFDESDNSWVDSSRFFNVKADNQQPLIPSSTASPTPSPTSTPTDTPTGVPGVTDSHRTSVILGAVLGTILGLIVICILALFFFKHRQRKRQQQLAAQAEEEKRRMSFADRGDPNMMDGGAEKGLFAQQQYPVPGSAGQAHHRHTSTRGSDSSTARLVPRKPVHVGEGEMMEMDTIGENGQAPTHDRGRSPRTSSVYQTTPKRSSGWSRYFGNGSAAAAGAAAGGATAASSMRRKSSSKSRGRYSEDAYSTYTFDSSQVVAPAEVLPPLKLGNQFSSDRVSRVVTGTPPTSPPTSSHRQTLGSQTSYSNRDSRPRTAGSAISATSTIRSVPEHSAVPQHRGYDDSSTWATPVPRNDWSSLKPRDGIPSSIYSRNSEAPALPPQPQSGYQTYSNLNPISESSTSLRVGGGGGNGGSGQGGGLMPPSPRTHNTETFLSTSSAMPMPERNMSSLTAPSQRTVANTSSTTSSSTISAGIGGGNSKSARVSDPDTWPRPPSVGNAAKPVNIVPPMPALRAEPMDDYDDDDEPEEHVEIVSATAAPTAVTAIPVPASTAMQYTVKKPSKQISPTDVNNSDMSWVNLGSR